MAFDELSVVGKRSIPYEQYFGEMDLPEEEKEKRIQLAEKLEPNFLWAFTMVSLGEEEITYEMLYVEYKIAVESIVGDKIEPGSYMDEYIQASCKDIVETTLANKDKEYFSSDDRAIFCAENEANGVENYYLQLEAIKEGKTKKTWHSMIDKRTRHTHTLVNGKTIGIQDSFKVGKARMMFPMDESITPDCPEECINCRCTVSYS